MDRDSGVLGGKREKTRIRYPGKHLAYGQATLCDVLD